MHRGSFAFVFVVALVVSATAQQAAPPVRVLGRVTNVLGDPVAAAEVWATDNKERVVGRAVADGDGIYRLPRLAVPLDAELVVHARAAGFAERTEPIHMRGAVRAAPLELEEGGSLAGMCVREDGTPIAGALVVAMSIRAYECIGDWRQEVTADAQGMWRIALAPLRPLRVSAWAPGFDVANERVAGAAEGLRLAMTPNAAVPRSVRVTGMPASGVVEAQCVAWNGQDDAMRELPSVLRTAVVAADGTAQLWPLPVHHDVRIVAGALACEPPKIACLRSSSRPLSFALVPKAVPAPRPTKRARIVDDAGKGLVGVRVLARVEDVGDFRDPDEFERVELQTDADGAFAFPSVGSKSRCKVALVSTRWQFGVAEASLESEGRTWLVASADEVLRATSVGSIRGTLRAASGQTFPGARVGVTVAGPAGQYGGFFTASDESGRLEICLPIGDYQLVVRAADGRLWRIPVACSAGTPAEIPPLELHPVGEIRGVVRDAEGRPVAGVQVTLVGELADADREPGNFREYARTDRQGRFRARYLAVGKWSVLLSRHGEPAAAIELEADKVAEIELRGWVPATGTSTSSR